MNTQAIKDVLSFRAFQPDEDYSQASLRERFRGKRYLLINVSRSRVTWRSVDRKGRLDQSGESPGDLPDVASLMAEEWKSLTDGGWVVVSLNNRFVITQESNLSRKPGAEAIIRNHPKSILGAKYDRSRRYSLLHHPDTSGSLLLACEEAMIQNYEETLRNHGFNLARMCCGLFAMVEQYLRDDFARDGGKRDFVLLACCDGSACILSCKGGVWTDFRSRSGLYKDHDIEPIAALAVPVFEGSEEGTPIILLHNEKDNEVARLIGEQLKDHGALDITEPDHLWNVIGKN